MTCRSFLIAPIAILSIAAVPVRFTAPWQPWRSPDEHVELLRPATAQLSFVGDPLGSLMTPGWRMTWGGEKAMPGKMVVRLTMKVVPTSPGGTATEVLQVGSSRSRAAVRSCLGYGLAGGSGGRKPDRVINGIRYAVWANGDAGMSQAIAATDLRTVVAGTCYAVERFSYTERASDGDPSVSLPQARGAAALDAALGSLRIGRTARPAVPVPALHLPAGAVAR